jgi:hypothetical protein
MMIVKPKLTNEEFYGAKVTSNKHGTMYNVRFDTISKPIFRLNGCEVKYPVGKYDKIVVEHNYTELFDFINKGIENSLGSESSKFIPIKNDELGIKVNNNLKHKTDNIQKYDSVDVLVEFNNLWVIKNKIYTSFTLKDIKICEENIEKQPEAKDLPFSFEDIE